MSAAIEDRVKKAHPLSPAHRMVLLYLAWQVPDGATEAVVNRTVVASELDTTPKLVSDALTFGASLHLCHVLKNGHIQFNGYETVLGEEPTPDRPVRGLAAVEPSGAAARPDPKSILTAFSRVWHRRYGRPYPFTPGRDHRLAKELGQTLTLDEISASARNYLADENPFWSECTHAFSVFHRNIHKFVITTTRHPQRSEEDARAVAQVKARRAEIVR